MLSVTDLRGGTIYEDSGDFLQVLSYEHIKMGRGSATIKVKVRNIRSGATTIKSFQNGGSVKEIIVENNIMQYLYRNEKEASFMNPTTFEQITISLDSIPGYEYLVEGENATIQSYEGETLGITLPPKVTLKVTETAPGVKGNTASNVYKDAKLENKKSIRVPLFINEGDLIVVDTRDGSYTKRA